MNNENGAALLARVKAGDLVTIRMPDGTLVAGRARDGIAYGIWAHILPRAVLLTAGNIVKVMPC